MCTIRPLATLMSRGLGAVQRRVLEMCRTRAEEETDPRWSWIPLDMLQVDQSRAEREAIRRAVERLAQQGRVDRAWTPYPRWLKLPREERWKEPPVVQRYGGHRGQQLVVRWPVAEDQQAAETAEWEAKKREIMALADALRR